jgi:hypothetical protein
MYLEQILLGMRSGSSVGGQARLLTPALSSTHWSRPCTIVDRRTAAVLSITPIAAASLSRSNTLGASPKLASNRRSAASATATTTPWPRRSMAYTRRGHPSAWPVTQLRGCRICDPRLGRLVQPSATTLTHLQHPTRRSRSTMLCCHQRNGFGSVTLKHQPPANPKRFTSGALARTIAWRILGAIEATAGVMLLVRLPAFFDVVVGRSRCPLHVMPTRA